VGRPRYESSDNRDEQREIATALEGAWNATLVDLGDASEIDYVAIRDRQAVGLVEVKRRRNPMGKYPTLQISLTKIIAGLKLSISTNLPFILAIQWDDATGYVTIKAGTYNVVEGGRRDRGDPADVELMIEIDTGRFRVLQKTPAPA